VSNAFWKSRYIVVTSGIPQGSVLDPILFTIYINDLPDVLYNMAKIFADDIKLYAIVNNGDVYVELCQMLSGSPDILYL
jgi:hypothetical protein